MKKVLPRHVKSICQMLSSPRYTCALDVRFKLAMFDMTAPQLPCNRPTLAGRELDYIREAISREQLAGGGAFTEHCEEWLRHEIGGHVVLLTQMVPAALEMATILIDLKEGDEVIMPSFTFVSTANAVVLRSAIPIFVDVNPTTLNIDHDLLETAITPRTKAIFPVLYAGIPVEMDSIMR